MVERLTPFVGISRSENLDRAEFTPGSLLARVRHGGALLCASTPFFDPDGSRMRAKITDQPQRDVRDSASVSPVAPRAPRRRGGSTR